MQERATKERSRCNATSPFKLYLLRVVASYRYTFQSQRVRIHATSCELESCLGWTLVPWTPAAVQSSVALEIRSTMDARVHPPPTSLHSLLACSHASTSWRDTTRRSLVSGWSPED